MLRAWIAGTVIRPVTTTMVTIAVLLFGLVAATRLPIELLPDISYPTITVRTLDPDAAPAEIEELVTRPIEERIGAVPGLLRLESVSREGESEIALQFAWGTAIDRALADVREKLDRVSLPITAQRPMVLRYDPAQEPVVRLGLRSKSRTELDPHELAALRYEAERTVKTQLEKIPGVAAVEIHGGEQDEILVELDPERMGALGLDSAIVSEALRRNNINRPGGAVTHGEDRYLIRTLHEATTPRDLGDIIIRSQGGAHLRLRDIADIRRTPGEREELSLLGELEAVELAVYREGDANIVEVANAVTAALPRLRLAAEHELEVLSNRARFIEAAIAEVKNNTLIGGALAVAILLFFLRNLRSTAVIAIAIPVSVLATFLPLRLLGISFNMMSLGGLALGVGMLVDNSIVVLESIARRREQTGATGELSRRQLVVEGTAEVAPSVVASTLTTVAVFLPISFVEGVAGELVRDLSYAVSFSILSSLVVSLTLVPVLESIGENTAVEDENEQTDPNLPRARLTEWVTWLVAKLVTLLRHIATALGTALELLSRPLLRAYELIEAQYPRALRVALRARGLVLMAAIGLCVFSTGLLARQGRSLLPDIEQRELLVQIELPHGAALERTKAVAQHLSRLVADIEGVEQRFARIGTMSQPGSASGELRGTHLAQLNVALDEAHPDPSEIEAAVIERLRGAPLDQDVTLRFDHPALLSFLPPLEILVFSEDLTVATDLARRLIPELAELDLEDIHPDDLSGRPEVRVAFDRQRLGTLGMTVEDASAAIARAVQGEVATTLYAADDQLNVRVILPEPRRTRLDDLRAIQIATQNGVPVYLSTVATIEHAIGPSEIRRIDGRRVLRIVARTEGNDIGGTAAAVEAVLHEAFVDQPNVEAMVAGQAEEMSQSLTSLATTAALSVFLVYVVMASSFESLWHPFLIMFTVPLAASGVALACVATQTPLSAMVMLGAIVLAGVVVNNAIVLVNAVNDRRGRGMPVQGALIDAGQLRIRPILMTTLTTIFGLLPMALGMGEGASLRQPLALAVIGGLAVATLLTLVVIPCAYSLIPGRVRQAWRR